jgi:hypothetical protein
MKDNIALYLLVIALLGEAIYLRSPMIAVSAVVLWGVQVAQTVLTRKNRDADITDIQATLASHKAKMEVLTKDITNVAERAKTILGDVY